MSSKSRKNTPSRSKNSGARRPADDASGDAGVAVAKESESGGMFDIPDELIRAPKETSKLRFALMIGLVGLLLLVFAIPDSIQGFFQKQSAETSHAFTWQRPGHGPEALEDWDLTLEHRALADAFRLDPLLQYGLGVTGRQLTRRDAARLHILRRLAEDSGIRVTEVALGEHLQQIVDLIYGRNVDQYKLALASFRSDVESTIRSCLAIQRYVQLIGYAGAIPHPVAVEKAWNDEHLEVAFDYIEVLVAEFEDAARTELPNDEDLTAWLDAKEPWEKNSLMTLEKRTADVVVYRDAESTTAAGLLEAFPADEDYDEDQKASEYHSRVFSRRFIKTDEQADDDEEEDEFAFRIPTYFEFDEVEEACLAEAPIYFAMVRWVEDLRARVEAGEEIDLAAEAEANGLALVSVEATTRVDLSENEELGDSALVNTLFATQVGSYSYNVAATDSVLAFVRVTESVEPALPPFDELRDDVADMWIEPRAKELAEEHLQSFWIELESYEPETDDDFAFQDSAIHRRASGEAFESAALAANHEVGHRDLIDRAELRSSDSEDAIDALLARNAQFGRLDEDEVAEPVSSPDGEKLFVVRLAETRAVPIDQMSPRDYERYQDSVRRRAQASLMRDFDLAFLEANFGLDLSADLAEQDEDSDEDEENAPESEEDAG